MVAGGAGTRAIDTAPRDRRPASAGFRIMTRTGLLLLVGAILYGYEIWWGLPSGNASWSVDALQPLTPLAVAKASFTNGWSSGWFYYKYPVGHSLLLCAVYAPYLIFLRATGGWSAPRSSYPYGFADPDQALLVLALLGRMVTFLMALATVWLLVRLGRRLWDERSAFWGAFGAALSPAVVYYAHTTNLDIPQLFWMVLAWFAAVRSMDRCRWGGAFLFGAASGMALATKESAYGWILGSAIILLWAYVRGWRARQIDVDTSLKQLAAGTAAGLLVLLAASNAFYNPLGFWHRLQFLTGSLPEAVRADLVPRASFVSTDVVPDASLLPEMGLVVAWSMGFAWVALSLLGLTLALRRHRRAAACILLPVTAYFLSLGPLPDVTVRYLLPVTVALALFGGPAVGWLHETAWGRPVIAVAAAVTLVHGLGVDYLLAADPRYQVEEWLHVHAHPGTRVETYHKSSYRPRPVPGIEIYRPEFSETTRQGIEARNPDLVLISLRDTGRIFKRYDEAEPLMHQRDENAAFLSALLEGQLGYRPIESFETRWPLLPDDFIRSLNPPLVLFARDGTENSLGKRGQAP